MKKTMGALALVLTLATTSAFACTRVEGAASNTKDLSIEATALNVGGDGGEAMITTLGTIKNASANCLGSVVVEVKYFDANNALIDTITELVNDLVVPAKGEVAFRIRDIASRPKEAYATQKIRVVSALPKGVLANPPNSMMEFIGTTLLSWAPMFLLIGVWIFFMRQTQRKDSPQTRTITLGEEQNALLDAQNKLLARIAVAVEGKPGKVE